jgi:hypothetical protein
MTEYSPAHDPRFVYSSLTRIAALEQVAFEVGKLPRSEWATGDYVVGEVLRTVGELSRIERVDGRMMDVSKGDLVIGAFGERHATLEATGTWKKAKEKGTIHALTGAGLFGTMTSKSPIIPQVLPLVYRGHVLINGEKANMRQFALPVAIRKFETPVVLLVGSSMSAGKTTVARKIIRQLKLRGQKVIGAKLSGAGRYRDILSMHDVGADFVFDFVDVGLASTVCPQEEYRQILAELLSLMAAAEADVAVVEIGASPLEPYNGDLAFREIEHLVRCTVLCASDPYAVVGVMHAFGIRPDLVSGVATNTYAGIDLVEKLCGIKALNLLNPSSLPELDGLLASRLGI